MVSRRRFLVTSAALASGACASTSPGVPKPVTPQSARRLRPGGLESGYDPWLEIDAAALRHNVREVARLAGGRPIMAVVKNNAYGLGDTLVGPLLSSCSEVVGIACARVDEALAMRKAGVSKPMLILCEVAEDEARELVANSVMLSCWFDDSRTRLERVAQRMRKPISVHLFVDTGLNREGMPHHRALPWIEDLATRKSIRIQGTYHMFVHDLEYDRVQHTRFLALVEAARKRGIRLGTLHAAPTFELFYLPESRLDMVRVSNALVGNYPGEDVRDRALLKPVFRLKARVIRVEQIQAGESAGFRRGFITDRPTWLALLSVGHTDGFPITAAGTCRVLINGHLYPIVTGGISSTYTILEIGSERRVEVGDTATLMGADDPAIDPLSVAAKAQLPFQQMITKFSALLRRQLT